MTLRKLVLFLSIVATASFAVADTVQQPDLKTIMQGLRDDLATIADGLLTDDLEGVAIAASSIASHEKVGSEDMQRVAQALGPEMALFKQFDLTVHDLALSLAAAAAEGNRARAAADYHEMLTGCLACHTAYKDRVSIALARPES